MKEIVVLTGGFVFHGKVSATSQAIVISDAHNIRVWGTTDGLGELALKGPTKDTKLDSCGDVTAPISQLIFRMKCVEWKLK